MAVIKWSANKGTMDQITTVQTLLLDDPLRRKALETVATLALPDCWIGAGFVRDAVWDHLHGFGKIPPGGDVDVLWFASAPSVEDADRDIERRLRASMPELAWSVKNQARMHLRNEDAPYKSVADAMRHWPETATAIAARYGASGAIDIAAPFGLDDLFALRLRPTPAFLGHRLGIFRNRVTSKRWMQRYPLLNLHRPEPQGDGSWLDEDENQ